MKLKYKRSDIIKGAIIYVAGDTTASFIENEFDWYRVLGIAFIGATIYAFEIPNYFNWIDRKVKGNGGWKASLKRAALSMAFFNPLWIARHLLFIKIFTGAYEELGWDLIRVGAISFAAIVPVSLIANHVIQNVITYKHRFLASSIFSGLIAIYYSLSDYWFG